MEHKKLQELAGQLRKPEGAFEKSVSIQMNETNRGMTSASIDLLNLEAQDEILEIGHGNCGHLNLLFEKEANIRYSGLELSQLMQQEAISLNQHFIDSQKASFHLYDGNKFPFQDQSFNKIFSVNTLYFWDHPAITLAEIRRVLQENGMLLLSFVAKRTLEELQFTHYGFKAYTEKKLKRLLKENQFSLEEWISKKERVMSNTGALVEREYSIALIKKLL
jgi:SAM-dependent methyltransferase